MAKIRDITGMPVNKKMCSTCPFGPNGVQEIRQKVEKRCLSKASQTCHHSGGTEGKPDTRLCRGARDLQLMFFYRLGVISEPTDEAWAEAASQIAKPGQS